MLSIISYHVYFDVSCNKRLKHLCLWNLLVKNPTTTVGSEIPIIYAEVDDLKVVFNNRQQPS
jgi:hypothetical protein